MKLLELYKKIKHPDSIIYTSKTDEKTGQTDVPEDCDHAFCIMREPPGIFVDPEKTIEESYEHHRYSPAIIKIAEELLKEAGILENEEELSILQFSCFILLHEEGHLIHYTGSSGRSSLAAALFKKIIMDNTLWHDKKYKELKKVVKNRGRFLQEMERVERERHQQPEEKAADEYAVTRMKESNFLKC